MTPADDTACAIDGNAAIREPFLSSSHTLDATVAIVHRHILPNWATLLARQLPNVEVLTSPMLCNPLPKGPPPR